MIKQGLKLKHPKEIQGKLIAKKLKLEFKSVWPGTKLLMFNVPSYGTSILAKGLRSAKRRLKETIELFSKEESK